MKATRVTTDHCRDTALAAVLVLLLVAYFGARPNLLGPAIVVLFLAILAPRLFWPAAVVWWKLAEVLATVGSTIMLTIVFAVVLTPIGLLRRVLGADALQLRSWGGEGSVFVERDTRFSREDLEAPF